MRLENKVNHSRMDHLQVPFPLPQLLISVFFISIKIWKAGSYFFKDLFISLRESACTSGERVREGDSSSRHPSEHRAQQRAPSQETEILLWAKIKSQTWKVGSYETSDSLNGWLWFFGEKYIGFGNIFSLWREAIYVFSISLCQKCPAMDWEDFWLTLQYSLSLPKKSIWSSAPASLWVPSFRAHSSWTASVLSLKTPKLIPAQSLTASCT